MASCCTLMGLTIFGRRSSNDLFSSSIQHIIIFPIAPLPHAFLGVGHLVSMVEMAKLLVARDQRLSITVLVISMQGGPIVDMSSLMQSLSVDAGYDQTRISFVEPSQRHIETPSEAKNPGISFFSFLEAQKPSVLESVTEDVGRSDSGRLAGFVVDMFCVCMIDVAKEFGVPGYVFFPSGASLLGLMYHLQSLRDEYGQDVTEFQDSEAKLDVPFFLHPFPAKVLPWVAIDKEGWSTAFLDIAKRLRETKGIAINTFAELESHAIEALSNGDKIPTVYPVGPILNLKKSSGQKHADIMCWLDNQPPSSVVFLCFGSMGTFGETQVKEIAHALEHSGRRFLWSLRRPASNSKLWLAIDYEDPAEVLPEGFLEQTAGIGKVIGWAPQVEVLSHKAVGGFVSHCGWNSTLESLWCGVPMATWPLHAEQQMNAFLMVKELGLAVEIKMDYMKHFNGEENMIVAAPVIESAINRLVDENNDDAAKIRKKMEEMSERSRKSLAEGGSSYGSLGRFIDDVIRNSTP